MTDFADARHEEEEGRTLCYRCDTCHRTVWVTEVESILCRLCRRPMLLLPDDPDGMGG